MFFLIGTQAVDESMAGGAGVKALNQQLQRLDAVVAERVDTVLAARGHTMTENPEAN